MSSPNSKVSNWLQNNFRLQDLTLERRFNAKNHQLDEPRFNVKNNRLDETRFINDGLLHKEGEIVEISDSPIIENCCSVMNEQNDHLNEFSDIDDFQQLNSPFETLERVAMDSLRDRVQFQLTTSLLFPESSDIHQVKVPSGSRQSKLLLGKGYLARH